jgi:hypothetical protein
MVAGGGVGCRNGKGRRVEEFVATLVRGFALFQNETAQLPLTVLAWMWVMRIVFASSIVFLPRAGAVATLGTMTATALVRFYIKGSYPEIPAPQIGAMAHIALWVPLAAFLLYSIRARRAGSGNLLDRVYPYWRILAVGVLAVSLVFDIREVLTAP